MDSGDDLVDDLDASNHFTEDGLAPVESQRDHIHMLVRFAKKRYPVGHAALLMPQEVTMSVRLNITRDDDVYARLKKEVPPKKLSAFIAGVVRAKLHPDAKAQDAAYRAASKEPWRKSLDENWKHSDAEGWPKGG
ncbi:MAG: hypothetical protein EWM73_03360 [Nitrospira sp.]|nr:MAG: hypothetical protein EWM73_03360 [Nitrospira sp.]